MTGWECPLVARDSPGTFHFLASGATAVVLAISEQAVASNLVRFFLLSHKFPILPMLTLLLAVFMMVACWQQLDSQALASSLAPQDKEVSGRIAKSNFFVVTVYPLG